MADQVDAGSLIVTIGARMDKLEKALKESKAKVDKFEKNTKAKIDVEVDKKGSIPTAGKALEVFQSKVAKVLGVAAGLVALVAVFGGIAKGIREAGNSSGYLADEASAAEGEFRKFAAAIPVIGQLGIALSDIGMALGLVEDGARKAAEMTAKLEQNLRLRDLRRGLTAAAKDLDELIFTLENADMQGTAAFDAEMFAKGFDPVQKALDQQRTALFDQLNELRRERDKFFKGGKKQEDFSRAEMEMFEKNEEAMRKIREEMREFEIKAKQALEARKAQIQNQRLEEEMLAQQKAAEQEQRDIAEVERLNQQRNQQLMQQYEDEQNTRKLMAEDAEKAQKKEIELEKEKQRLLRKFMAMRMGINKDSLKALKEERAEIKKQGSDRASRRKSLGETQSIDTAIGSFTIGRDFSPMDNLARIESDSNQKLGAIDKRIERFEKILKSIEKKSGSTSTAGAFT